MLAAVALSAAPIQAGAPAPTPVSSSSAQTAVAQEGFCQCLLGTVCGSVGEGCGSAIDHAWVSLRPDWISWCCTPASQGIITAGVFIGGFVGFVAGAGIGVYMMGQSENPEQASSFELVIASAILFHVVGACVGGLCGTGIGLIRDFVVWQSAQPEAVPQAPVADSPDPVVAPTAIGAGARLAY